ncbi:hypothetical protein LINPERPRIM_LOCUS27089, partial [Linum perenne]
EAGVGYLCIQTNSKTTVLLLAKRTVEYPTNTQLWFTNFTSYVLDSGKLALPMSSAKQTTRLVIMQIWVMLCALVPISFHFMILCYRIGLATTLWAYPC